MQLNFLQLFSRLTFSSIAVSAEKCEIVEIAGADLIALNVGGTDKVYAACSTF